MRIRPTEFLNNLLTGANNPAYRSTPEYEEAKKFFKELAESRSKIAGGGEAMTLPLKNTVKINNGASACSNKQKKPPVTSRRRKPERKRPRKLNYE